MEISPVEISPAPPASQLAPDIQKEPSKRSGWLKRMIPGRRKATADSSPQPGAEQDQNGLEKTKIAKALLEKRKEELTSDLSKDSSMDYGGKLAAYWQRYDKELEYKSVENNLASLNGEEKLPFSSDETQRPETILPITALTGFQQKEYYDLGRSLDIASDRVANLASSGASEDEIQSAKREVEKLEQQRKVLRFPTPKERSAQAHQEYNKVMAAYRTAQETQTIQREIENLNNSINDPGLDEENKINLRQDLAKLDAKLKSYSTVDTDPTHLEELRSNFESAYGKEIKDESMEISAKAISEMLQIDSGLPLSREQQKVVREGLIPKILGAKIPLVGGDVGTYIFNMGLGMAIKQGVYAGVRAFSLSGGIAVAAGAGAAAGAGREVFKEYMKQRKGMEIDESQDRRLLIGGLKNEIKRMGKAQKREILVAAGKGALRGAVMGAVGFEVMGVAEQLFHNLPLPFGGHSAPEASHITTSSTPVPAETGQPYGVGDGTHLTSGIDQSATPIPADTANAGGLDSGAGAGGIDQVNPLADHSTFEHTNPLGGHDATVDQTGGIAHIPGAAEFNTDGLLSPDGSMELPAGSNPWEQAQTVGEKLLNLPEGQHLDNTQVAELAKILAKDSNIRVDSWGLNTGAVDQSSIPAGYRLNFTSDFLNQLAKFKQ